MTSKHLEIIANILFWVLTGTLISHGYGAYSQTSADVPDSVAVIRNWDTFRQLVSVVLFSAVCFYAIVFDFRKLKKIRDFLLVLARSLLYFIGSLLLFIAFKTYFLKDVVTVIPHFTYTGIFAFYFIVAHAYGFGNKLVRSEREQRTLALEKKAAELSVLRSQLQPHFLFNVLNNLLSMVDQKQSPKLAGAIDQLSQMLRYVVYDVGENRVPIQKEIEFIRSYAKLQETRFENQEVNFKLNIHGDHRSQLIEPGLFIPFIENTFKHGVRPEVKSEVSVDFDLSHLNRVRFRAVNTNRSHKLNGGSGILLTKERLELTYPNRHTIEIEKGPEFIVTIEIDTNESSYS
ncbi:MAG: histidine kinase [Bacteroidota bacterium]